MTSSQQNISSDAQALSAWVEAVGKELGLEAAADSGAVVDMVLDLAADVAHHVSRPGAPVTAFLIGVAAGRASDPNVAARDYAEKVKHMAEGWNADSEGGGVANDQSQRA